MKRQILTVVFLSTLSIFFVCCNSIAKKAIEENNKKKEVALKILQNADTSKCLIVNLPLNLKFGMSKQDVENILDKKVESNEISKKGKFYYYNLPIKKGSINSMIMYNCSDEGGLYSLDLIVGNMELDYDELNTPNIISFISNTYAKGFDFVSVITDVISDDLSQEKIDKLDVCHFWVKQNLVIKFKYSYQIKVISFNNASITGGSDLLNSDIDINKKANEIAISEKKNQNSVKVVNSYFDGSVRQVVKYLKSTLKDPDSYESMEWSTVIETNSGYQVRHKYRAKNGFGGFVIENNVFILDKSGNVINVDK